MKLLLRCWMILSAVIMFGSFSENAFARDSTDVVYLKDGSKIVGEKIEERADEGVKMRMSDGSEYVYSYDRIERVTKEQLGMERRNLRDMSYAEFGLTLGTPAGINFALGSWFGPIGFRVSGMQLGKRTAGIQVNVGYKLSDNATRSHVLAVVAGSLVAGFQSWGYAGVVYNLNLSGFFVEAGLTAGSGSFTSPQAILQIGYVHRFL
jgi:hypothetical protein